MRCISPIEIALNDILFYSFRSSSFLFDSIIPRELEEYIKESFYARESETSLSIELMRKNFIKMLEPGELEIDTELLSDEINNNFSSFHILNKEPIQLISFFDQIIASKKLKKNEVIITNESYLIGYSSDYILLDTVYPFESSIVGFLNYIDTSDEAIDKYLRNYEKFRLDILSKAFISDEDNKIKKYLTYFKIFLRICFINSVSTLRLFKRRIPIYLFDGNKMLIKVEPIFESTSSNFYISYCLVKDKVNIQNPKLYELNYEQLSWYIRWNSKFRSSFDLLVSQTNLVNGFKRKKRKMTLRNKICKSQLFNKIIMNDKILSKSNKRYEENEMEESNSDTENIVFSENKETHKNSIYLAEDATNQTFLRLSNKQNYQNDHTNENSDFENSSDYVEKLIQQQSVQLFNH